jgi:succinyl-diaminopimelate desuccinylase
MGAPTLNVGTVRGGLNINSVPDAAEMTVDIRSVAGLDHQALFQCLCATLGPQVRLTRLLDVEPLYTPHDEPWMQRVFALVRQHTKAADVHAVASYFSDASALRPVMGMPPTVILGPGEPAMAHQTDEYCEIDKIRSAEALYAGLIDDWCAGPT